MEGIGSLLYGCGGVTEYLRFDEYFDFISDDFSETLRVSLLKRTPKHSTRFMSFFICKISLDKKKINVDP